MPKLLSLASIGQLAITPISGGVNYSINNAENQFESDYNYWSARASIQNVDLNVASGTAGVAMNRFTKKITIGTISFYVSDEVKQFLGLTSDTELKDFLVYSYITNQHSVSNFFVDEVYLYKKTVDVINDDGSSEKGQYFPLLRRIEISLSDKNSPQDRRLSDFRRILGHEFIHATQFMHNNSGPNNFGLKDIASFNALSQNFDRTTWSSVDQINPEFLNAVTNVQDTYNVQNIPTHDLYTSIGKMPYETPATPAHLQDNHDGTFSYVVGEPRKFNSGSFGVPYAAYNSFEFGAEVYSAGAAPEFKGNSKTFLNATHETPFIRAEIERELMIDSRMKNDDFLYFLNRNATNRNKLENEFYSYYSGLKKFLYADTTSSTSKAEITVFGNNFYIMWEDENAVVPSIKTIEQGVIHPITVKQQNTVYNLVNDANSKMMKLSQNKYFHKLVIPYSPSRKFVSLDYKVEYDLGPLGNPTVESQLAHKYYNNVLQNALIYNQNQVMFRKTEHSALLMALR